MSVASISGEGSAREAGAASKEQRRVKSEGGKRDLCVCFSCGGSPLFPSFPSSLPESVILYFVTHLEQVQREHPGTRVISSLKQGLSLITATAVASLATLSSEGESPRDAGDRRV